MIFQRFPDVQKKLKDRSQTWLIGTQKENI